MSTVIHRQLTQKGFPLSEAFSSAKHAACKRSRCRQNTWNSETGRAVDPTTKIISLGNQYVTNTTISLFMHSEILQKTFPSFLSSLFYSFFPLPSSSHKYFLNTISNSIRSLDRIVGKTDSRLELELTVQ